MNDHPVLFSAPMIRSILGGRKTMTRRIVKPQPSNPRICEQRVPDSDDTDLFIVDPGWFMPMRCRYQPGDTLWVRETFFAWGRWETRFSVEKARDEWHFVDMTRECGHWYAYAADSWNFAPHRRAAGVAPCWWKRPAIFMPRHASRITLQVTDVRVERLQQITEDDAAAEGCNTSVETDGSVTCGRRKSRFRALWGGLNAKRGYDWNTNPWVWVISFERVEVPKIIQKIIPAAVGDSEQNTFGPTGTHGCACPCPGGDAGMCTEMQGGSRADPCECICHDWGREEAEAEE